MIGRNKDESKGQSSMNKMTLISPSLPLIEWIHIPISNMKRYWEPSPKQQLIHIFTNIKLLIIIKSFFTTNEG